ncbi:MAG: HigA family addiction module antidote protein [Dehalococcoidia bacterium]|nr:HigA family addiction module antidote protein [Dehalococcoidia bacterium]
MINPPHPGESVRECIDEVGMTVKECAMRIGVTPNNMYRLVNGRIGISPKVALGLESLGWSNAEFWMRLQAQYDLAQLRLQNSPSEADIAAVES